MKNIKVMAIKEFRKYADNRYKDCPVIHVRSSDETAAKVRSKLLKGENSQKELMVAVDDEGFDFKLFDADRVIRFCEKQFDIDTVVITYKKLQNIAYNIADVLTDCYEIGYKDFEFTYVKPVQVHLRFKYKQIKHSLLHVLSPMDYCKLMVKIILKDIRDYISGKHNDEYFDSFDFFCERQCSIYFKNGTAIHFHLETTPANLYLPDIYDIDDVEYVEFYGVPEIADPSAFEDMGYYVSRYIDYGIYDFYGQYFRLDSEKGIVRDSKWKLPEKYKNYKSFQREWYEFNRGKGQRYPQMEDAYAGVFAAERFLADKTGYEPVLADMPIYHPDESKFYSNDYLDVLDEVIEVMKLAERWDLNELEYMCAYAAYIYTGSLCACGHCENMTIIKEIFGKNFRDSEMLYEFDRLWSIEKYVPCTSTDPVNILCLAVYSLVETVRPYYGRPMPEGTYSKCLNKAFELTEGRIELNNAILMAGAFAGVYCQSTK